MFDSLEDYLASYVKNSEALAGVPIPLVAEYLDVGHAAITQQLRSGKLTEIRIGKTRLVSIASLLDQKREKLAQKHKVQTLLETAAREGRTSIFYGEIMGPLEMSTGVPAHRTRIGQILGEISEETSQNFGVLLSVLVHRSSAGRTKPGPGFFNLAEYLGYTWDDERDFIEQETQKVLMHYGV